MSAQQPFFTFSSNEDIATISFAAHDVLRKKQLGAKLNYKEAAHVICHHIIEEAGKGRSVKQIVDSSGKLLHANDVMLGVPEMMEKLVVNVRFKDGKIRQVVVDHPMREK